MTLLERMQTAIDTMTAGEKLMGSLQVTILGVGIVFVALMLLFVVITGMNKTLNNSSKEAAKTQPVEPKVEPKPEVIEEEQDETELVAVITAAVAASLHTSTHNIVVRNITRTPDNTPAWAKSGRMEQISNRL